MNQKPLFLTITTLALLIIGGAFWFIQKQPVVVNQPTVSEPVTEEPGKNVTEKYAQHITAIPDSSQVWYEIPEMGIRILLSKEGAEETVYNYSASTKKVIVSVNPKTGEEEFANVSSATLSSKQVLQYNADCNTPLCGTDAFDFGLVKIQGIYNNHPLAFGSKFLKQFDGFYITTGGSPQAAPFANAEEEKKFYETVRLPKVLEMKAMHIESLE